MHNIVVWKYELSLSTIQLDRNILSLLAPTML